MANNKIDVLSNQINIFPVSKIRKDYREDNLLYEQNIANIISQLTGPDIYGFIINAPSTIADWNDENTEKKILLNIYGYYIKLSNIKIAEKSNLYVTLKIKSSTDSKINEIHGQDSGEIFDGIYLTEDIMFEQGNNIKLLDQNLIMYDSKGLITNSPNKAVYKEISLQLYRSGELVTENFRRFGFKELFSGLNISGIDGKY